MFTGLICFAFGVFAGVWLQRAYGPALLGQVEADVAGVAKSVENAAETIGKTIGKE